MTGKRADPHWTCTECDGRFVWSQTFAIRVIQRLAHLKTNCPAVGTRS